MKKIPLFILALITASLSMARATSVTFGGIPTARTVVGANSGIVTSGLIWAGTFSSTAFSLNSALSLAANVAAVTSAAGWKQFTLNPTTNLEDPNITNTLQITGNGKVAGVVTDSEGLPGSGLQASFFDNKPLYLWIFNGSSVGTSTEMGIFRATSANSQWTFPTNAGGVGDATTLSTVPAQSTIAAFGGFGSTPTGFLQLTNNFNVSPVPEPATLTIGIFAGAVGLCVRRRR